MAAQTKVFIVLEGPDMTYYGTAEIHGVYASREAAEAKAREKEPDWKPEETFWPIGVEEWEISGELVT